MATQICNELQMCGAQVQLNTTGSAKSKGSRKKEGGIVLVVPPHRASRWFLGVPEVGNGRRSPHSPSLNNSFDVHV